MEESFRSFTGGLSNVEVVIFVTENNDTFGIITDDEFLQIRELWHHNRDIILTRWYENKEMNKKNTGYESENISLFLSPWWKKILYI